MEHIVLTDIQDKKDYKGIVYRETDFAYIFEIYYKRVYNYIYYRVNSCHATEDLTSQVFEKIMIRIDTYCEDKAPFEVWIFAIARNVINDYFRDTKKRKVFSMDLIKDLVSNKRTPEDIVETSETKDELLDALKVLNERERNIIGLKFGADLKNIEIAEVLGLTESNVGVILYRTMKKLKNELKGGRMHE